MHARTFTSSTLTLLLLTACTCPTVPVEGAPPSKTSRADTLGIPTLDDMAGDWIDMGEVSNPPAVHNFNQMLVVNRDLTSYFCNPGGLYPWRQGYPMVKLQVDGCEYPAQEARAYAYRALRRNMHCNGVAIETDTHA